jgi:hypothetical protein
MIDRAVPDREKLADDLLIGAQAIADEIGFRVTTVYVLAKEKRIPVFKLGGIICARRSQMEKALWAQPRGTGKKPRGAPAGKVLSCPFCDGPSHLEQDAAGEGVVVLHDGEPSCPIRGQYFPVRQWNGRAFRKIKDARVAKKLRAVS